MNDGQIASAIELLRKIEKENSSIGVMSDVLYNGELLQICHIDGKYCLCDDTFTLQQIHDVMYKCKMYLDKQSIYRAQSASVYLSTENRHLLRPLTDRQIHCATYAIKLLANKRYNHALHEFMDCIDDYNKGNSGKEISINEYGLYSAVVEAFIMKLESVLIG